MAGKLGSAPPQRGYTEAVKRMQGERDPSGRGAPDEGRGFPAEREDAFGGGPEGMAASYGPGQPEMHDEDPSDAAPVGEEDARERSRRTMLEQGDVPKDGERGEP